MLEVLKFVYSREDIHKYYGDEMRNKSSTFSNTHLRTLNVTSRAFSIAWPFSSNRTTIFSWVNLLFSRPSGSPGQMRRVAKPQTGVIQW